jgi:DNA mismatch repair protein MutH
MPQESMSFKNIDYGEVYNNDNWLESEVYEIFTSRFLFVVFTPDGDKTIRVYNNETQTDEEEQSYTLASVFFWTMPPQDLEVAQAYWQNIRNAVVSNRITPDAFWRLSDAKKFHVRPKARIKADRAINPHGGLCDKYCYWFNAEYVKTIIANHSKNEQSTT